MNWKELAPLFWLFIAIANFALLFEHIQKEKNWRAGIDVVAGLLAVWFGIKGLK